MSDSVAWRTGRKVGRTIYAQQGPVPSDDDPLIGVMDTPKLAAEVCGARNAEAIFPAVPEDMILVFKDDVLVVTSKRHHDAREYGEAYRRLTEAAGVAW